MGAWESWENPSKEYRIKPFWFWNGNIEKEEIDFQLRQMKEQGIGGAFICPRQGLSVPYLGREWMELVEYTCERGKELGLEIWLYDEYPYPSGMAGGETLLRHPEAVQKQLVFYGRTVQGGERTLISLGWGKVLYAGAVPVDSDGQLLRSRLIDLREDAGILQSQEICMHAGMTAYTDKRFFSYGPEKVLDVRLPEGEWRLEIFTEEELDDYKYYGNFFDPCNSDAVRSFLDVTHERYRHALKSPFASSIKGIFSDEVFFLGKIPWSEKLPERIEKKYHYNFLEKLPALCDWNYPDALKIRYQLYQTAHELLREAYHKQIADWCRGQNVEFVTETPSMRRSTQLYSTVPGGDACHEKTGVSLETIYDKDLANYRSCAPGIASLARQTGRKNAMIESFHSVGWTMTLQDAKWMLDYLAAMGINFYTFHAFCYTIGGLTKHDAPPSQFFQNPYWKHYRLLADYAARLRVFLQNTEKVCKVALLDPVASLWTHLGSPRKGFSYAGENPLEEKQLNQLREDWIYLAKVMLFAQVSFDFLDGEILCQARIEEGKIYIGKAVYEVLVLPPMTVNERKVTQKIQEFSACGGKLIATGMLPGGVIDEEKEPEEIYRKLFGAPDANKEGYWKNTAKGDFTVCRSGNRAFLATEGSLRQKGFRGKYLKLLEEMAGKPEVTVRVAEGNEKELCSDIREDIKGAGYVFLSNHGGERIKVLVESLKTAETAYRFWPETGKAERIQDFDGKNVKLELEARESALIGFDIHCEEWNPAVEENEKMQKKEAIRLEMGSETRWKVHPETENVYKLEQFDMSLDRANWKSAEPDTFIELCDRLGWLEGSQIAFSGKFGTPKKPGIAYPVTLCCRCDFKISALPPKMLLMMDREAVSGKWEVKINGLELKQEQFKPHFVYDKSNMACDITHCVRQEKNTLEICIKVERDWGGLREPLYLLGDFGVEKGIIVERPTTAVWKTGYIEGFPWYSGTLCLEQNLKLEKHPESNQVNWILPPDFITEDCLELSVNGVSLGTRAFSPYSWECGESLLKAENRIQLKITNTLGAMLD